MFKLTHRSRKLAFTLLELIVVIVILGVLTAIAVPQFSGIKTKSAESVVLTNAQTISRHAQQLAALDGAALSATYVDQAGEAVNGYQSATHSVTSSTTEAVALIDTSTGAVTLQGSAPVDNGTIVAEGDFDNWNNRASVTLGTYPNFTTDATKFFIQRYALSGTFEVGDRITISNAHITDQTVDQWYFDHVSAYNGTWTVVAKGNSMGDYYYLQGNSATTAIGEYSLANHNGFGFALRGDYVARR